MSTLREFFPWPAARPDLPFDPAGWMHPDTEAVLRKFITGASSVLEVGTWLGLSTRFMLDQNQAANVVCVDTWLGSLEHFYEGADLPRIRTLYEGFASSCWDYRERIVPVRLDSVSGIKLVARCGFQPDFIYLDGGHEFAVVSADIRELSAAWPTVPIVCDDYGFDGVARACAESGRSVDVNGWAVVLS